MSLDLSNPTMLASLAREADREIARRDLLEFTRYTFPSYEANWHHERIAAEVMAWLRGDVQNLAIQCPPQHGKSELISRRLPAFLMLAFPQCSVIAASYAAGLSSMMAGDVRRIMREEAYAGLYGGAPFGPGLVEQAEQFQTRKGGSYYSCGVGGGVIGRGYDFGIIDDPIKDAEEAFSPTMRANLWQWYTRVWSNRKRTDRAKELLIMHRWHEDDLLGRILGLGGDWRVVNLEALATQDEPDRRKGEPLWPGRFGLEFLLEQKRRNPNDFEAKYQGRPFAEGGGMFKRKHFRYAERNGSPDLWKVDTWRNIHDSRRFLTVDLATSTKDSGDYTVIAAWAAWGDQLLLLEVLRDRMEGQDILPQVALMLNRHNAGDAWIEKMGFQTMLIQEGARLGLPVRELRPDKDKQTRAAPLAAAMANGKVWFAPGPWLPELEHELLSFPAGAHDDQVDALAYGERVRHELDSWQAERIALY